MATDDRDVKQPATICFRAVGQPDSVAGSSIRFWWLGGMGLPFDHDIQDCLQEAIGEGGLPRAELDEIVRSTGPAMRRLLERPPACIAVARETNDLAALESHADRWRSRFKRILLLGTGGSSLGARVLTTGLAGDGPEIDYLDNLDISNGARIAEAAADPAATFLLVSKSGGTPESLAQSLLAVEAVAAAAAPDFAGRFLALAEPGESPLRRLAEAHDIPLIDLDPLIDGRFSVLSPVGMLPALLRGLDATAVRAGAVDVLEAASAGEAAPALGAALQVGLQRGRGISQSVLFAYGDRLAAFGLWYRQLWAESLGKDGRGTTPIASLGPLDQHSQLQLYLDGPWDKLFTVMGMPVAGTGARINGALATAFGLEVLGERTLGDLLEAMHRATADTLAEKGRPVRRIELGRIDEATLGGLFMHFMLETLIAADLLGVDPFGQPAVEASKALARQRLAEMASAELPRGTA